MIVFLQKICAQKLIFFFVLALGMVFFAHFVSKRRSKLENRKVELAFHFLHDTVRANQPIRREWISYLKKKMEDWSGKAELEIVSGV